MDITQKTVEGPWRPYVVFDPKNDKAKKLALSLDHRTMSDKPNIIVVLGGDGFMLKIIRKFIRKGLPFFGINCGHLGFLLNDLQDIPAKMKLYTLPVLEVQYKLDGYSHTEIAINDVWVERATSQTAWMQLLVDGVVRLPMVQGDGLLVSTPQGSTAYARAMGGLPLPLDTNAMQLVGSNITQPKQWRRALLSLDQTVGIQNLDEKKRPINLFVDGMSLADEYYADISQISISVSKTVRVNLAFDVDIHLAEKITRTQFPQ